MTRHYPELGSSSDWLKQILNQSEALPISEVSPHQYGIFVLVSQSLFRGETSGGVAKSRVFSQAGKIAT